jgi:hypothetical protein
MYTTYYVEHIYIVVISHCIDCETKHRDDADDLIIIELK